MFFIMIVLGIETSCDETSLALVSDGQANGAAKNAPALSLQKNKILAMETWSQLEEHRPFGGVVPEVAARAHLDKIMPLLTNLFRKANLPLSAVDAIAATHGPGLIGGLIVGAMLGKVLSFALNKPLVAVNHLAAHALSVRLDNPAITFPYLTLLVSGGHCQLLLVRGVDDFLLYGETLDDSAGEAFDKGARLLGLPQPGGPAIEHCAKQGVAARFPLPTPMKGVAGCDFSFSGLKTALKNKIMKQENFAVADAAASLQQAIGESLKEKSLAAMKKYKNEVNNSTQPRHFCLVGGVAANQFIRGLLQDAAHDEGFSFVAPAAKLCTDNGAMIGWAGIEMLRAGISHDIDYKPRPRWATTDLNPSRQLHNNLQQI